MRSGLPLLRLHQEDSQPQLASGVRLPAQALGVLRFDFTGLGQSGGDFADSTHSSGSVKDVVGEAARAMRNASMGAGPCSRSQPWRDGAVYSPRPPTCPNVKAIATRVEPYNVQRVTEQSWRRHSRFFLEQGEAEVKLGSHPFKMRR